MECKFCDNVISHRKDGMFFHLGYQYDGNGLVPPSLNDMEVRTHIPNGRTKDVAMEMLNPLMEGESISTFQVERARNFTPPPPFKNNTNGPNKSTNNNI